MFGRRNHDIGGPGRTGCPWRAQRATFSMILTFLRLEIQKIVDSHGQWDSHGHIFSSSGAKIMPIFLMLDILNARPAPGEVDVECNT